jgi:broad specificity phosphatase PhoE
LSDYELKLDTVLRPPVCFQQGEFTNGLKSWWKGIQGEHPDYGVLELSGNPFMKQVTQISFVRHGHVHNPGAVFYGRLPGFGLDAQGVQDAQRAGRALCGNNIAAVFSSPLLRARQTGREVLSSNGGQPLRISKLLTEVHTCFEGRPSAEIDALQDDIYTGAPPGCEQPSDIAARGMRFMQRMRRQYAGKHIAAITHGDIIVFMILWAKAMPLTPANKLRFSASGVLDAYPATGSITTFIYRTLSLDEKPAVRYLKPL